MSLNFNIISNINNGHGLQRDYELVKSILEGAGHVVHGVEWNGQARSRSHINIFLEMSLPQFFPMAKEQWLIPNAEWWNMKNVELPSYTHVLCKTQDCLRIFREKVSQASFLGFESQDCYRPEIPRERKFLHVAGKSELKNTVAVLDAWARFAIPHQLTLITSHPNLLQRIRPCKMVHHSRVDDATFVQILNSHRFHLCPSQYEGWGHYLHEARAVGGVVLTTNAPPMNEFAGIPPEFLIPSHVVGTMRSANLNAVTPDSVCRIVTEAASTPEPRLEELSQIARQAFVADRDAFRFRLLELVAQAERRLL